MNKQPRLYVACVRCGHTETGAAAVDEALAYHRAHGDEPFSRERSGDYVVWDLCPDCCEVYKKWSDGDDS